ncbi:hypothetical protein Aperf_G00000052653 [Anoplocephala perfoliata]
MELPDFTCLWEANSTLTKLKEALEEESNTSNQKQYRNPHLGDSIGPARPLLRRLKPQYRSDGICGVNFGIVEPEFANPLATCCQMLFFTQKEYECHISEHVSCPGLPGVENSGCGRDVHPSVIKIHLEIDHRKKADGLNDAKETLTKSWREARAKNYPTFERVQAKIREVGYRMERGQVFLTRKFGSLNRRAPLELHPISEDTIKRFKTASENDELAASLCQNLTQSKDGTFGIPDTVIPDEIEQIDENEKVFSEKEEEVDAEPDVPVLEIKSESEDDRELVQGNDQSELQISDGEAEEVNGLKVAEEQRESLAVVPNYASDCSWSEEFKEEEEGDVINQPESLSIPENTKITPIVDYDSDLSWSEEVQREDAGDPQIKARFSPPKEMNLIDQLGFFKPHSAVEENEENEENKAGNEVKHNTSGNRGYLDRRRRRRERYSQKRGGRRNHPGTSMSHHDNREGDEDIQKPPTAIEAELDLELDEVSSKGGQKAFANHPVVQMATRRRLCMRRASTITKRPTLLHMLLAEEIRHERNQLMQCVRFVVNNNFFLPK